MCEENSNLNKACGGSCKTDFTCAYGNCEDDTAVNDICCPTGFTCAFGVCGEVSKENDFLFS